MEKSSATAYRPVCVYAFKCICVYNVSQSSGERIHLLLLLLLLPALFALRVTVLYVVYYSVENCVRIVVCFALPRIYKQRHN